MKIVSLLNRKGGVGKSTTCYHLAGALAEAGHRVLVIDNDASRQITRRMLDAATFEAMPLEDTVAGIYLGDRRPLAAFARPVWDRVDVIAGSTALDEADPAEPWDLPEADQLRLAEALADGRDHDVCLIDCEPFLRALSWNALLASDAYVVPVMLEDFGAMNVEDTLAFASRAAGSNPRLRAAGIVLTMRDGRLNGHAAFEHVIRAQYGGLVFDAVIPRLGAYSSAITDRKPVTSYDRRGAASAAIRSVCGELLTRLGIGAHAAAKAGKGVA